MKRVVKTEQGSYMFVSYAAIRLLEKYSKFFPSSLFNADGSIKESFKVGDSQKLISDTEAMEALDSMNFIPYEHLFDDASARDLRDKADYIKANHDRLLTILGSGYSSNVISAADAVFLIGLEDVLGQEHAQNILYEIQKPLECRRKDYKEYAHCIEDMYANYDLDISELAYIRKKEEKEREKEEGPVKTMIRKAKGFMHERFGK